MNVFITPLIYFCCSWQHFSLVGIFTSRVGVPSAPGTGDLPSIFTSRAQQQVGSGNTHLGLPPLPGGGGPFGGGGPNSRHETCNNNSRPIFRLPVKQNSSSNAGRVGSSAALMRVTNASTSIRPVSERSSSRK